jgi:hypothetical protein
MNHFVKKGLEYGSKVATSIRTYLDLHLVLIKTTIDIRILNDFEFNLVGLRHRKGIERWHLTSHVVQNL